MRALHRLWHSRDWMLIPLGVLGLLAAGWWILSDLWAGSEGANTPRFRTDWNVGRGAARTGPTIGMSVSDDGYGTVIDAPLVQAPMAEGQVPPSGAGSPVAEDVAPFIRAWPRETPLDRARTDTMICTLESPPRYVGKLVLIDGCLRFQPENSAAPGPLVLARGGFLGRDGENYLAVGPSAAQPEYRLRVGEPGGVFMGVGCSMDAPVPAPPELARQCGVDEMIRLGTIKRKPLCSPAYLERRRRLERQEQETAARLQRDHDACVARTGVETGCPPAAFPANVELFDPPCQLPPGAGYPYQGSSTQPKPSR